MTGSQPSSEDRTVAILCYITLLGFVIAIVLHSSKKTQLGAFHLRQSLGLIVTAFATGLLMIIPILGWFAAIVLYIALFIFLIMGFVGAVTGSMKPVPLLGAKYQQWFAGAFT